MFSQELTGVRVPLAPLKAAGQSPFIGQLVNHVNIPLTSFVHAEIRTVACETGEFVGDIRVGVGLQHSLLGENRRPPT
jgi:hypothetical protein